MGHPAGKDQMARSGRYPATRRNPAASARTGAHFSRWRRRPARREAANQTVRGRGTRARRERAGWREEGSLPSAARAQRGNIPVRDRSHWRTGNRTPDDRPIRVESGDRADDQERPESRFRSQFVGKVRPDD